MKRLFFIAVLFAIATSTFGQVHKRFLDKNDKYTPDSTKAKAYILYQKESDSLYTAVVLDMHNIPICKGAYSDESLTVPEGKFVYYRKVINQKKIDEHSSSIDTGIAISKTGYYIAGKKEGIWVDYNLNGIKVKMQTLADGLRDGLYEEYYSDGKIYTRSNYIQDVREGDSYVFHPDSSIAYYLKFWHGGIIDSKEYSDKDQFYGSYPGFNFEYHVHRFLKKLGLPPSHGSVVVDFTVTIDGKLTKPKLALGVNPILDEAIMEAVLSSPTWEPAKKNHKAVEQRITLAFEYDTRD